ncbi:uncharacterized protein LOC131670370 [Phymastichus coffea]|uniref:uncharacterized protein LOC131667387 n=1 Tax=Phymastichus coffea TaxID=108790 RepID=UPI00273CC08D|nr:uncharacterized protein LOC131667387 [Phymastichus coffea]XP_058801893.1 uncharacterized protein LOC131670370 [Phymastichus coffea]
MHLPAPSAAERLSLSGTKAITARETRPKHITSTMTMEERSSGIEDGAPVISTGAPITSANGPSNLKSKACEITTDASYPLQRANKRSFDVAFLVAPDEKLIKRQAEKLINLQFNSNRLMSDLVRHHERQSVAVDDYNDDSRDYEQNDRIPQNMTIKHFESLEASHKYKMRRVEDTQAPVPSYISTKRRLSPTSPEPLVHPYATSLRRQKTPSPPTAFQQTLQARKIYTEDNSVDQPIDQTLRLAACRGKNNCDSISCADRQQGDSRSAFTKVNLSVQRSSLIGISPSSSSVNCEDGGTSSPRSSVSPDVVTYQNSLSPPIGSPSDGNSMSPFNKYPANFPTKVPYPFLLAPEAQQSALLDNLKLTQQLASSQPAPKVPSPKVPAAAFRPELPAAVYPNLPYNPLSAVFPPLAEARPRFLATGILPSSFAALGLAAQNVCAKCNLSFRMTSDLVYHMRSHHKSEHAGEAARRRREEKLRCPVCDESFRERHHLTRHMTAHQDKESDAVADQVEIKRQSTLLQSK